MRKHFLLFAAFVCICYSSGAQSLVVPYIPVQRAAPLDFSDIDAKFARESQVNVNIIRKELQDFFTQQVLNVDMLPLRKKVFQTKADTISTELSQRAANGRYMDGVAGSLNSHYRQIFTTIFDATLIQSYKEEYRRVKEWELHLRDKNLLDVLYKNGTQSTNMTNREAISALYGTDKTLFNKVNWK